MKFFKILVGSLLVFSMTNCFSYDCLTSKETTMMKNIKETVRKCNKYAPYCKDGSLVNSCNELINFIKGVNQEHPYVKINQCYNNMGDRDFFAEEMGFLIGAISYKASSVNEDGSKSCWAN